MSILFIGNFLSRSSGSQSISEFIADRMQAEGNITVLKASHAQNKFLRLGDILFSSFFGRYSILHIDVFSGNSFLFARMAAFIGKLRGKKIVLTLHGGALHEYYPGRENIFKDLFENTIVRSPSNFLKNFFGAQNLNVAYCPNPIQLTNFPYQRSEVKPFSLLWVRAFTEIYNPHVAVLVLQKIVQDFTYATLTMVGPDKGLLKEIEALIKSLNLSDRVTITGPVANDVLHSWYQSHAVYLNTTSYESFGVAVVEAASCGVPVVSFRVGEIPYLWTDEENILLCDAGDVEAMSVQVKRILGDAGLSTRLSTHARQRAEDFSWEIIKPHWLSLLRI